VFYICHFCMATSTHVIVCCEFFDDLPPYNVDHCANEFRPSLGTSRCIIQWLPPCLCCSDFLRNNPRSCSSREAFQSLSCLTQKLTFGLQWILVSGQDTSRPKFDPGCYYGMTNKKWVGPTVCLSRPTD
jgi:hypothetical protein